ncbi:MAG: hypothetical protein ABIQ58_01930, partial [Candidatus Limnocylindrales bacterium]
RPSRPPRAPRTPNKATLGSTSYDGADGEPFEPDWGGASWYGTTSGTYWTLNPKEYADPRKHGPEYQARARRAAEAARTAAEPMSAGVERPSTPTHTTSSWWDATAAADGAPGVADPGAANASEPSSAPDASDPSGAADPSGARPESSTTRAPAGSVTPPPDGHSTWDAARWLEPGRGGVLARVGRAVAGWAPIALGIGWVAGEITGCGRYAADCDASSAPVAWFAQFAALALLLIVPRLATAATIATIGALVAAVPGALLLTSMGGATDAESGRVALGFLLIVGWVGGLALGLVRELRRLQVPRRPSAPPTIEDAGGPVS